MLENLYYNYNTQKNNDIMHSCNSTKLYTQSSNNKLNKINDVTEFIQAKKCGLQKTGKTNTITQKMAAVCLNCILKKTNNITTDNQNE